MLNGKLALITGASKGIGEAIATKFSEYGANLVIVARDNEKLEQLQEKLQSQYNNTVYIFSCDLSAPESAKSLVSYVMKLKCPLDVLVNNAGIMRTNMLSMVKRSEIDEQFNLNVFALMQLCQLSSRLMIRKKSGSIINLSSIMGHNGSSGVSVYSGSKAAVLGFSKSLSKELAPYNIRVNSISPGFIDTDMTNELDPEVYQSKVNAIAMKRSGSPEEVANAALFLASDLSAYITGEDIGVDGGMVQ